MSQGAAGLLLGAVSLAATVSRISVGIFADRRGQEPLRPVATMLAVSIVGYLLLIAGEPVVIVIAALLAGSFGWAWPGGLTLAVVQRSPGAPAWAVGVLMAGLFTGAIAGPLLIGVLAEQERFAVAWSACATCALLAAATVVATRRLRGAAVSQLVPAPACNADSGPATPSTGSRISNVVPRPDLAVERRSCRRGARRRSRARSRGPDRCRGRPPWW